MHIALDETCVEVNGLKYWVYAALDVDRNKIISMMVFQELAGYKLSIEEVLLYCVGNHTFVVDRAPLAQRSSRGYGPQINRRVISEIEA
jgi:transposase-like protein